MPQPPRLAETPNKKGYLAIAFKGLLRGVLLVAQNELGRPKSLAFQLSLGRILVSLLLLLED